MQKTSVKYQCSSLGSSRDERLWEDGQHCTARQADNQQEKSAALSSQHQLLSADSINGN